MSTHGESVNDVDEISSGDSSEDGEEEEDHEEKQVKSKRTSKSGGRQQTWSIESERLFKRKKDWELHETCYYKGNQYKISLICSNVNPRQYVLSPTCSSANTETRTWKDMLTPQEFQTAAVAKGIWTAGKNIHVVVKASRNTKVTKTLFAKYGDKFNRLVMSASLPGVKVTVFNRMISP
jgi:hypothetical protein